MSQGNQGDNRPVIKVSEVLAMLAEGKSRKQIAKDLGVSYASAQKNIFSHPKLKNRKVLPQANFIVEDDAPDAPVTAPRAEEVAEEATTAPAVAEETATEVAETAETSTEEAASSNDTATWRE